MGDTAFKAGQSFSSAVSQAYPTAREAALNAIVPAHTILQGGQAAIASALPSIGDFLSGAFGSRGPTPGAITMQLPAATPAKAAVPAIAAAPAVKAAVVDPTAGLSGLSFRQLLTLAQTGQAEQRATPKPVSAVDQAGNQLASIYQGQFSSSLKAAGNDPGKQQAAIDAFEKKMLPIALKGNTADAAIFDGSTPGAQ